VQPPYNLLKITKALKGDYERSCYVSRKQLWGEKSDDDVFSTTIPPPYSPLKIRHSREKSAVRRTFDQPGAISCASSELFRFSEQGVKLAQKVQVGPMRYQKVKFTGVTQNSQVDPAV
jgi:hypothetical protein